MKLMSRLSYLPGLVAADCLCPICTKEAAMSRGSRMQTMRTERGNKCLSFVQHLNKVGVLQDEGGGRFGLCHDVRDVTLGKRLKEGAEIVVGRIEIARLVAELLGPLIGGEDVGQDVRFRQVGRLKRIHQQRLQECGSRTLRSPD